MTVESVLTFQLVKVSFCWLLLYSVYVVWWPRCSWRIPCLHLPISVGARGIKMHAICLALSSEDLNFSRCACAVCAHWNISLTPVICFMNSWPPCSLEACSISQESFSRIPFILYPIYVWPHFFFREEIIKCLIPLDDVRIWSCFLSKALKEKWDAATHEPRNKSGTHSLPQSPGLREWEG